MRLRLGDDEIARNRRQQEVMRTVFLRLVEGGNLVRVPELYETYRSAIDTNLTLDEILASLPLALKLGDPSRIGYFQLGDERIEPVADLAAATGAGIPLQPAGGHGADAAGDKFCPHAQPAHGCRRHSGI